MLIESIQRPRFAPLKNQNCNSQKLRCMPQLVTSDSISFSGKAEIMAAEKIITKHTWISGGLGFTLSQVIGVDSAALLGNNVLMIRSIAKKVYKSNLDPEEVKRFIAGASLSAAGIKAAAGPITFIPVVGNVANTAISAGITKTVGKNFIKLCEKSFA